MSQEELINVLKDFKVKALQFEKRIAESDSKKETKELEDEYDKLREEVYVIVDQYQQENPVQFIVTYQIKTEENKNYLDSITYVISENPNCDVEQAYNAAINYAQDEDCNEVIEYVNWDLVKINRIK